MRLKWLEGLGRELRDLIMQILRDYSEAMVLAVIMAVVLRLFVVGSYKVSNPSMEPSLNVGDFIIGFKLPFGVSVPFTDIKFGRSMPRRNDVVVLECPTSRHKMCVKRIVALPGDRIEIKGKRLIVNERLSQYRELKVGPSQFVRSQGDLAVLEERTAYGNRPILISSRRDNENFGPYIVPPGSVFVLSDNRDFAEDSRHWGAVPLSKIESRVQFIWFSVEWRLQPHGRYNADVRWPRIFSPVH